MSYSMKWAAVLLVSACASSPGTPSASHPQEAPASSPRSPTAFPRILNARTPLPGVLTGGAPTLIELEEAERLGYRTIISLLPEAESQEEAAAAQELGLRFVSIPIAGPGDLTEDNARKLGDILALPDARPLILHCASGNRAGALLALWAYYVDRRSATDALALGDAAGLTKLRPNVESVLNAADASR